MTGRTRVASSLLLFLPVLLAESVVHAAPKADTTTLPAALKQEGFVGGDSFKAFVIEIDLTRGRKAIANEVRYDWGGTSKHVANWNPASSVKLFAAVGALKRLRGLGFSHRARVTFHGRKDRQFTVGELVRLAIGESDNIAYNRLVQLAGFDFLHKKVFSAATGFPDVGLLKAYESSAWIAQGEDPSLRVSPPISLREGRKKKRLPATVGVVESDCRSAACASLRDLGECVRRVMLQEQLPAGASFGLATSDLRVLRLAMQVHPRGNEVVTQLRKAFGRKRIKLYSKPGFSQGWYSDAVYIQELGARKVWVVALANHPGRNSLNKAAHAVGRILAKRRLAGGRKTADAAGDAVPIAFRAAYGEVAAGDR